MSLFDYFRRRPVLTDVRLGELRFARGRWTSHTARCFGETGLELRIRGNSLGIAPDARQLLESLESRYAVIKTQALPRFQEHYEPYAEAIEELEDLVRSIRTPEDLWSHIKLVRVWVGAYGKAGEVELAYTTAWDCEHTIGVTVSDGRVTDFCGSVQGP